MANAELNALQKSLTQRLKGGLSASEIRSLAKTIDTLQQGGMAVDDVFPIGIVVNPDGVTVRGHLPIDAVTKIGELIPKIPTIKDIRVFPRGIIAPDKYRVHLTVER
jgi:hypothetical protein